VIRKNQSAKLAKSVASFKGISSFILAHYHYKYRVITNYVNDYIHLLVRIAHIICNHPMRVS